MKVGILTFSNVNNRGAIMQCYGLSSYLRKLGHEPLIISIELPSNNKSLKGRFAAYVNQMIYNKFRKKYYLNVTRCYKSAEELRKDPPIAEAYIVGSDQVWNSKIISGFGTEAFFLDFVIGNRKRISYAASLGEDKWKNANHHIEDLIDKFDHISVREEESIDIIRQQFGIKGVKNVLDPVFLPENYNEIIDTSKRTDNGSIVCMSLYSLPLFDFIIKDLSRTFNKKIDVIGNKPNGPKCHTHPFVGVKSWLKMIYDCHLVITNSFHCMAFCIIFKKNFIALPSFPGRESRMVNLLEKLGLSERFVWNESDYENRKSQILYNDIDYNIVNPKLNILRNESVHFLKKALS